MSHTIAISGKGGTGKTTISALIIKYLIEKKHIPVLAVDADPNSNLYYYLGVEKEDTIGNLREEVLKEAKSGKIPAGISKETVFELKFQRSIVENKGFDLLTMGRPEGPGCYCYANIVLRRYVDELSKNYKFIVIDNEAGMEHLSRRTTQNIEDLLIISDPTPIGIITAGRIRNLVYELELNVNNIYLVLNRINLLSNEATKELIKKQNLNLLGTIAEDKILNEYSFNEKSILELPSDSASFLSINAIIEKLGLTQI
ncbi:MAG: AAA family ATPase [Actinobacteria bacterium]|nr:AAA family ATPase [Actinomycetota bacterium]